MNLDAVLCHGARSTYRLRRPIGAGGMGIIHLATDDHGRTVAVKRPYTRVGDHLAHQCLHNEALALPRITNRRVAQLVDAATDNADPFIALDYVQGRIIAQQLFAAGPLPEHHLARLASGLARALQAIHDAGLVHRDLNPTNVILCPEPARAVIIDFGLARPAHENAAEIEITGTKGFIPPEIFDDAPITPAADVFAWAGTIAFAATGRLPHGTGPTDVVLYRAQGGLADLHGVPERLLPALRAALSTTPERRPSTDELLSALRATPNPGGA